MASSDFARRQLTKHGWKKGAGLGKNETGISEAIKVKIKTDKAGIGTDPGEQFTFHWWDHAFNKAANNIKVENTEDGVKVNVNSDKRSSVSTKKTINTYDSKPMLYGRFIKSATLTSEGLQGLDNDISDDSSSEDDEENPDSMSSGPTDEQLFKACGGLTAHKAARHGHKLSGKLQRIEQQERELLMNFKRKQDEEKFNLETKDKTNSCKKKKKKKRKEKEGEVSVGPESTKNELNRTSNNGEPKRKCKKKCKNTDTVTVSKDADFAVKRKVRNNDNMDEMEVTKVQKRTKLCENGIVDMQQGFIGEGENHVIKKKKKKKKRPE
ncbi:G patch domain-containing protein 4-like [Ptychodera flava]|uniref:G patch domain-containing protein 4-like n=1 Tax=Ptychodera flava TaxID=63121 RepID=UPI003969E9DE